MKKLPAAALVLIALLFQSPGNAQALSCVAPTMSESVIQGAVVIFEGMAGQQRAVNFRDNAAIRTASSAQLGGRTDDLRVFDFTVTKGWKGIGDGKSVQVLRNTYWGDNFKAGESYLVVGEQKIGELYLSPLCGNTVILSWAVESGILKTLERLIGGSQAN